MPTVPTYSPGQIDPEAAPRVTQDLTAPIDAFGGGDANHMAKIAKTVTAVGESAGNIHAEYKRREDERNLLEIEDEVRTRRNQLLEAQQKQGKSALGLPLLSLKDFDAEIPKILKGRDLSPPAQQQARQFLGAARDDLFNRLGTYAAQQERVHHQKLFDNRIARAIEDAIHDPQKLSESRGKIGTTVNRMAVLLDWTDEQKDQAENLYITEMYEATIKQIIDNGRGAAAVEYLNTHQAEINKASFPELMEAAETAVTAEQGRELVGRLYNPRQSLDDIINAIDKSDAPDEAQRQAILQATWQRAAEDRERENARRTARTEAFAAIDGGKSFSSLTREQLAAFTLEEKEILPQRAIAIAQNEPILSDTAAKAELYRLFSDDPESFSRLDPTSYRGKLSPGDYARSQAMLGTEDEAPKTRAKLSKALSVARKYLASVMIDPNATEGENAGRAVAFQDAVLDEIEDIRNETGKFPDPEAVLRIADDLLLEDAALRRGGGGDISRGHATDQLTEGGDTLNGRNETNRNYGDVDDALHRAREAMASPKTNQETSEAVRKAKEVLAATLKRHLENTHPEEEVSAATLGEGGVGIDDTPDGIARREERKKRLAEIEEIKEEIKKLQEEQDQKRIDKLPGFIDPAGAGLEDVDVRMPEWLGIAISLTPVGTVAEVIGALIAVHKNLEEDKPMDALLSLGDVVVKGGASLLKLKPIAALVKASTKGGTKVLTGNLKRLMPHVTARWLAGHITNGGAITELAEASIKQALKNGNNITSALGAGVSTVAAKTASETFQRAMFSGSAKVVLANLTNNQRKKVVTFVTREARKALTAFGGKIEKKLFGKLVDDAVEAVFEEGRNGTPNSPAKTRLPRIGGQPN